MSDFKDLELNATILDNLNTANYIECTPIQAQAIPHILDRRDILGIAQTGTGKTGAFSIPLIQNIINDSKLMSKVPSALILAPTRELATQIDESIQLYSKNIEISSMVAIGGVHRDLQVHKLNAGIDIVVGTPGRIIDLIEGGELNLDEIKYLVLDEADMMLDMGFLRDIELIQDYLRSDPQTSFFSATMPSEIEELANNLLVNPIKIEVATQGQTIEEVSQELYFVEDDNKLFLLNMFFSSEDFKKVLVFCKAKYSVSNIVDSLTKSGVSVDEIHSNRTQKGREEALDKFNRGEVRVLVATDIASRGIHVDSISHVINFNVPEDPSAYVHRIGRTARAKSTGTSITLCGEKELTLLRNIEKLIKLTIPRVIKHPFHKDFVIPKKKKRSRTMRRR